MTRVAATALQCAVLVGIASVARADTWTTVDDFSVAGVDAQPYAIGADNNYVYVAGTDGTHAIVRRRSFGGTAFATVDSFIIPGGDRAVAQAITFDSNHNRIFVAGQGTNAADLQGAGSLYHWWVRVESQNVWSTTRVGTEFGPNETNDVGGIAYSTIADKLFVNLTAAGTDGSGTYHAPEWLVKQSTDSGATSFNNRGTFAAPTGPDYSAYAGPIGFDGYGDLMSLGLMIGNPFDGGQVESLSNNTWTLQDELTRLHPTDWMRHDGDFYYAGYDWVLQNSWVVRKSPGSTGVWSTVDSFTNSNGAAAKALTTYAGVNYAAGWNGSTWLVKKSSTGSAGTWVASDTYSPSGGAGATTMCTAHDAIWAAGVQYESGHAHWVVRMFTP